MSVLVYTESDKGNFKKNALEVASYANKVATQMGTSVTAILLMQKHMQIVSHKLLKLKMQKLLF